MRVVSLLPAATEICAALGALDLVAGVTHECDFPPEAARLPRVTASAVPVHAPPGEVDAAVRDAAAAGAPVFTLDEGAIAALRPDVLLTQALCDVCAVSQDDVCAIAARLGDASGPAPAVVTLGGTTLAGVCDDVRRVAEALGRTAAGEALVDAFRARLAAVHEVLKAARAPRPRVAVVEWTDPVFLAGHWGPEMVRRAGGVDVLGTAGAHSTTVAHETLAAAEPELVVVAPCGYDLARACAEAAALAGDPRWAWLRGRAVWAVDANAYVSRPGPRLVDGVELFARIFHPRLFGAPEAERAARVA
ncbi:cobalamin-binding protein [Gemmatimonadetes bacterium T265]|nr:cobalamin-binding protein [Gemmatimonadetes bacterium T265]